MTGDLWHPGLVAVPVDLEPVRVTHVQVVGRDEVEDVAVRRGALPLDGNGRETGLGVGSEDGDVVGGDGERVGVVDASHGRESSMRGGSWRGKPFPPP